MKPVNAIGEALATSYTTGHTSSPTALERVAPNGCWGMGWTASWCHLCQMSPAAMGSPAHSDSAAVLLGWEGCKVRCLPGKSFTPGLSGSTGTGAESRGEAYFRRTDLVRLPLWTLRGPLCCTFTPVLASFNCWKSAGTALLPCFCLCLCLCSWGALMVQR